MKRRHPRIETPEEFYQEYGVDINDLPDPTEEDFQQIYDLFAVIYRKALTDEKLDALEELWEYAEEEPEFQSIFRRVHEDPTFGHEDMLEKYHV